MRSSHDDNFPPCAGDKSSNQGDAPPTQALNTSSAQEGGVGPQPSDAELLANIKNNLDIMGRLRGNPQSSEEFQFCWNQVLKLLEEVTGEHRAVISFLKERLALRGKEEPFEVDFNLAARLASINLKKHVTTFYSQTTSIPASKWNVVGPNTEYFVVREGDALVLYHKFYNPKK